MSTYSSKTETPAQRKRILVVDDDAGIVSVMKELITRYAIISAASGEDALRRMNESNEMHPDLTVIDHRLPDLSGLEVLRRIKGMDSSMPIIYMTAYGDEDIVRQAFRYGASDYIKKPFSCHVLEEMIGNIIHVRGTIDSVRRDLSGVWHGEERLLRSGASSRHVHRMERVLRYIGENYIAKLKLSTLARIACMSEYHFSRVFKVEVGVTFQDYLNHCRIEKAKCYLKNRSLPVTEIAYAVGYNDLSNFIRMFKKVTGYTPSEYANIQAASRDMREAKDASAHS